MNVVRMRGIAASLVAALLLGACGELALPEPPPTARSVDASPAPTAPAVATIELSAPVAPTETLLAVVTPAEATVAQPAVAPSAPTETPLPAPSPGPTAAIAPSIEPPTALPPTAEPPTPTPAPTVQPALADAAFTQSPCQFERPQTIRPRELECGFVVVPEDPAQPDGRKIRLAIARFRSRATAPGDPLFYLSGGPGSSGIDEGLAFFETVVERMIYFRDVVLIDQRGTGASQPSLDCPLYRNYNRGFLIQRENLTKKELQRQRDAALQQCLETIQTRDVDPALYITRNSAADIDGIRRALGFDKVVLWGTSYGTTLALEVMRAHQQGVRSAILESPAPPQVNLVEETGFRASRAFAQLFAGCRASERCNTAYPQLEQQFFRIVARLDRRPQRLTINRGPRRVTVTLDGGDFASLIFLGMYSTEAIEYLPALIDATDRRDYDGLDVLLRSSAVTSVQPGAGLYYSVMCAEEVSVADAERLRAARETHNAIGSFIDDQQFEICARWPHAKLDAALMAPVRSDIPTLILTGEYDPTTPPEWGALIAADLPNSQLFQFPGFGHGVVNTRNECASRILLEFVQAPERRPDSATCIEALRPPLFYTN
jgi:pimeloyl-ACP methyl ester carboxylesterase